MFIRVAFGFGLVLDGWLLAATDGGNGSDLALLFNYGVLGLFTLAWMTGRIETAKRADLAEQRAAAAEQRARTLEDALRTEVVPAMTRFTEVGARIAESRERGQLRERGK